MATTASASDGVHLERLRAAGHEHACRARRRLGDHADARQQLALLLDRDLHAEEAVDARRSERDVHGLEFRRVRVDDPGRDRAAGPRLDEPGAAVGAEPRQPVLLALLEAEARLGPQGVAERRPADAHRVEDGRLDDDVGGRVRDLGRGTAHDPGDRRAARPGRR